MMRKEVVERYEVLLSGIEERFVQFSLENPKLHDNDILKILEELMRCYRAKYTNFSYEERSSHLIKDLYEISKSFFNENEAEFNPKDMLECLKLLKKSLQLWNKEHGSRGYIKFISQFIVQGVKEKK